MMRAMNAGISGLRAHQTLMDVIGNNIANSGSIGYKSSRLTFREALSASLGAQASRGPGLPATHPVQIGLGAQVGSVDALFSQGAIQQTGQPFDFAIAGRGLFVLSGESGTMFSRAGNFVLDADGRLLLAGTDLALQGINGSRGAGSIGAGDLEEIRIPTDEGVPPRATSRAELRGNLRADAAIGDTRVTSIGVFDGQGGPHTLEITFTNTGGGTWSWTARCDGEAVSAAAGAIEFDENGRLRSFDLPDGGSHLEITLEDGTTLSISLDAGTPGEVDGVTGFARDSSVALLEQDGYAAGELTGIVADSEGVLLGVYSNGVVESLAQIVLADFGNLGGLSAAGNGVYGESASSGAARFLVPGDAGGGSVVSGALEGSNVDLAQELTAMIIAQRGFQANARVVMAADEMLNQATDLLG